MVPDKEELTRKRVLYIGSAVPIETADGLEGVQKPLSERYPIDDDSNIEGILSVVSVLPTGLTLQYISDPNRILFFPISSLSLCAAVRCISTVNAATGETTSQFVSISSPTAGGANSRRPAIFTAITRRTEGRKVLECHGFVCASSKDALELVRCTSIANRAQQDKAGNSNNLPAAGASFRLEPSTTPRNVQTAKQAPPKPASAAALDRPDGVPLVNLVPGHQLETEAAAAQQVAPEFYEAPPEHGYFYKTRDSQIRMYAVERLMEGEPERVRVIPAPVGPQPHHAPTLPRGGPERRLVYGGPVPASMTLPHPQARTVFPVRHMHPSAAMIRPRFFSPPPPMMRPRPMPVPQPRMMTRDPYVIIPPPPPAPNSGRRRQHRRRGSESSSRGSSASASSSSPSPTRRELNGRHDVINGDRGDNSSDGSCRPPSPPTDYDKAPRVSRREQFDQNRRHPKEAHRPGNYGRLPGGPPMAQSPYDFYVYPHPHYAMPGYGSPQRAMERARSMPPPARRGKSKERKKGRKASNNKKKDKKRSSKKMYSDLSTDSVGYASEVGAAAGGDYPRQPRDFRRFENQFKHEQAFSKSLSQEFRGGGPAENSGLNDHMAQRGGGYEDFYMY